MTMLEYKRYRKKSLKGRRKMLFFGRRKNNRGSKEKSRGRVKQFLIGFILLLAVALFGKLTHTFFATSPLFHIDDLKVVKESGLEDFDFEKAAKINEGKSIFALDLKAVVDAFQKNPWVEDVAVRKVFPGKLVVILTKRKPVAMLNLDGLYFIDAKGRIFKKVSRYDTKIYPVITGFDRKMMKKKEGKENLFLSLELREMLKGSVVEGNVSEINYSQKDGPSLVLKDSGLRIKLGSREITRSFARLEKNYEKIKNYRDDAAYVDLKYPGKIFVGRKKAR